LIVCYYFFVWWFKTLLEDPAKVPYSFSS